MPNRLVYPRGYDRVEGVAHSITAVRSVEGDTEVTLLYRQYMAKHGEYQSWAFRAAVMQAAKRLIGRELARWVNQQNANRHLDGNAIRFIGDTIKFITEGRREVSHLNWLPLLTNLPQEDLIQNRRYALSKTQMDAVRSINLNWIQAWLSQPGGFEDLLISLYAMYGEIDSVAAFKSSGAGKTQSPKNFKADLLQRALR